MRKGRRSRWADPFPNYRNAQAASLAAFASRRTFILIAPTFFHFPLLTLPVLHTVIRFLTRQTQRISLIQEGTSYSASKYAYHKPPARNGTHNESHRRDRDEVVQGRSGGTRWLSTVMRERKDTGEDTSHPSQYRAMFGRNASSCGRLCSGRTSLH